MKTHTYISYILVLSFLYSLVYTSSTYAYTGVSTPYISIANAQKQTIAYEKSTRKIRTKRDIERTKGSTKNPPIVHTGTVSTTQKNDVPTVYIGGVYTGTIASTYTPSVQNIPLQYIPGVDMQRARDTYIGWYNTTRTDMGLSPYIYDSRLDTTALEWANTLYTRGETKAANCHKRSYTDSFYDFKKIDTWFVDRGISPKIISRAKHTENVGWGTYKCTKIDCTDDMIASVRHTYDFFMSEKGKKYDAHYRTIVQPHFTQMGMGIVVDTTNSRYYMVLHHVTEI